MDSKNKLIKIDFLQYEGQKIFPEQTFCSRDKKLIRIGRSKKAEIIVNDNSVSRIQCTLVFEDDQWILYDGVNNNSKKSSTNGIW
jgi:pSer/pThr/pTyr-binding forkhead associated (FHA) protein